MKKGILVLTPMFLSLSLGCSTLDDSRGRSTMYEDVNSPSSVAGVGVESQDIVSMTDRMMRDMLSNPALSGRKKAPYVIIDGEYFENESSSIINKNLITERLMVNLNRAANGRMVFVERSAAEMVEKERKLKRQKIVSKGTMGNTATTAGADFRLTGKIMSLDAMNSGKGTQSRYHQITFKMIDMESGVAVWTGIYEFKKAAQDDIIYR